MTDAYALPTLFDQWLRDALPAPLPSERGATCDACAMCPQGEALPTSLYLFDAEVKCCVYQPELPNFLVGRALDEPGGHTVQARIDRRLGLTPLGLDRPASYNVAYRNSVNTIGRARSLRCPHFLEDGGRCGIWKSRDALCSTWFCRHERGPVGAAMWMATLELLAAVQHTLSWWAVREEGLPLEPLAALLPKSDFDPRAAPKPDAAAMDGRPNEEALKALWGDHYGAEADFYRATARRVEVLSWAEVLAIGGPELQVRLDLLRSRQQRHRETTLPERLTVGAFEVVAQRVGGVRVVTYSSLDALDLPNALLGVLPAFDGRPTQEVLDQLESAWNLAIDPALLQRLVDWGVLRAA